MPDTRNVESINSVVAYSILQSQIDAIIETMKSFAPTLGSQLQRALGEARNQTLSALQRADPNVARVFLSCFDKEGNLIYKPHSSSV